MKIRFLLATLAFCLALNESAMPQSIETRPRRVDQSSSQASTISTPIVASTEKPKEQAQRVEQAAMLEAMVPRAGLQYYLEVRSSGLGQLSQSPDALAAFSKAFAPDSKPINASEMTGFVVRNLNLLSNAKLAVAGYGANGAAVIIELNSPDDIEKLKADLSRLMNANTSSQKTESTTEIIVAARGRVVLAGARSVVENLVASDAALTLDEDREYLKARAQFAGDPFFAYMDTGSFPIPLPENSKEAQSQAYMASLIAGLSQMPYAMALGGSMNSADATVRALIISGQKKGKSSGFITSLFSATHEGQPIAPAFASADTDVFVDVMVDWDKLYEGLQSVFDMFASSVASIGSDEIEQMPKGVSGSELLAGLDAMFGFSIRYDLLPTLGNELAIATSGPDGFLTPRQPGVRNTSNQRGASSPTSFLLMIAVRNPVKFEGYLRKLLSGPNKSPVNLAQMPYRGTIIKYRNGFAYAIAGGFFIAGGNTMAIRRALDARATGVSLATNADFRSAVGPSRPAMLQAYFSSKMVGRFNDAIVAKGEMKSAASSLRVPLGLVMTTNPDGTMMQMRMPSTMALATLTSMTTYNSSVPGINYSSGGVPANGKRRRSPMLTTEDLRYRKP